MSDERFEDVTLVLSSDEALVLDALLTRFDARTSPELSDALVIEHPAERAALWALEAALERVLVDIFKADYTQLLGDARSRVRKRAGL